jgi:glutamate---cysteine ligase / carboxylate-amine ligase
MLDRPGEATFGIEEELMLLDPRTLDLRPNAADLLDRLAPSENFKLELPASHIELVTGVHGNVAAAIEQLGRLRSSLAGALEADAVPVGAGVHPFAAAEGTLNRGERYEAVEREYGLVARRQLVCGLHIHVRLSGATRALAVYNALRGFLPEIAALAANAPIYEGRDTGLASVRPLIAGLLPRQGIPPAYSSLQQLADDLAWGSQAGRIEGSRGWWWAVRLHPELGTLELRAPDAQSTLADVSAIAAVACSLALWLAQRHDDGESLPIAPSWRIAENSWSAIRDGVHGSMLDLQTAKATPTSERLQTLLARLEPIAAAIGAQDGLRHASAMSQSSGADRQRAAFAGSPRAAAESLCSTFLSGV